MVVSGKDYGGLAILAKLLFVEATIPLMLMKIR